MKVIIRIPESQKLEKCHVFNIKLKLAKKIRLCKPAGMKNDKEC